MNTIKNFLKNSNNKIKIIFIVLISISLLWSLYWYSVFKSVKDNEIVKNNETENYSWSLEKSSSGTSQTGSELSNIEEKKEYIEPILLSAGEADLNYKLNINWKLRIEKNWTINETWEINIKDLDIVSMDNWLKQRINMWSFYLNYKDILNRNNNIQIEETWIDLISNDEKLYIYMSWGTDSLSKNENIQKIFDIEKAIKINKLGEYIMVDNSKLLLDSLWKIWKNELVKELILALSTNNPEAFLEKNWTIEKIQIELKKDKIIDYIFEEIQDWWSEEKVHMKIKDWVCENISKFYQTILWNIYQDQDLTNNCKESIKQINSFMWMTWEIYKEWDIKKWDYKFYIKQWNLINIVLEYKSNTLINWDIKYNDSTNWIELSITWDDKKMTSSKLNLNVELNWLKISWYILNWEWELKIAGNFWWFMNISWSINLENYKIKKYEIVWKWETFFEWTDFSAIWDENAWKLNFISEIDNTVIWKYDLEYNDWEYRLNIVEKSFSLNWSYKKDKFNLKFFNTLESENESWFSLYYNHWKIYWNIKDSNWIENSVNWNYKSIKEFDLEIINKDTKESTKLSAVKEESKVKYLIDINSSFEKITVELEIEYAKWSWEYKIPWNYEEINLKNYQTLIIPNLKESDIMIKENDILWLFSNLLVPIYNSYNSIKINETSVLMEESEKNIDKLNEIIFKKQYAWEDPFTFVIWNRDYISYLDIDLENAEFWKDYIIWTPNYEALWINKQDFINPVDNDEYVISISNIDGKFQFQVLYKHTVISI